MAAPASMCARLMRSRSSTAAAASSTRVLTPSVSAESLATWASTPAPPSTRSRTASVRYSSPCAFAGGGRARAEQLGPEEVDGGVALADGELVQHGVAGLDDRAHPAAVVTQDASVGAHVGRLERQHGGCSAPAAVSLHELREQVRGEQRRVAPSAVSSAAPSSAPRAAPIASPVPSARSCTATSTSRTRRASPGRRRRGRVPERAAAPPRAPSRPCAAPGSGAGVRDRGAHARAEAPGHHDCCETRSDHCARDLSEGRT